MTDPIARYHDLRRMVDERLAAAIDRDEPVTMYEPARYVLGGGGKRIRPVLVMLAAEAAGGDAEDALDAGVAIEILHNFTLVHDDIMDNAAQRRGRETVHTRWDPNIAILVGDGLIGVAYATLLRTSGGDMRELISLFTDGMMEVCEGQSYDKEFELRPRVSEREYLMMIAKKTGALVRISAELGAAIGGASPAHRAALSAYAEHVGRAFQIQDDLLDVTAVEAEFGKSIGGDILEGKKTYLLVRALDLTDGDERALLEDVAQRRAGGDGLVARVAGVYERCGVLDDARARIAEDTALANAALAVLPDNDGRAMLDWFARMLLERTH
jgi:geranylgeranyl diphosphate synthase, type II